MTVKELKAYLDKYQDNEKVSFIAVNIKNRIVWPNYQIGVACITDTTVPVIGLELRKCKPFYKSMVRAAEGDER